jgi:hypothetical protein
MYSALGTLGWTTALATAGMILEARFGLIGQHVNVVSNALLAIVITTLVIRYMRCWRRRC